MVIVLSIGGLPVGFEIRSKGITSRIRKRYHGFILKNVQPLITFQCYFSSRFIIDNEEVTIEPVDNNAMNIYRSDFLCTFNSACGEIYMRRSIYSFDACLRVLYSILLTADSGLLLHATGIIRKKKAFIFLGPSGSGKTTVARLSFDKGTVINDEIVALKIENNGVAKVYGTPFWGEMRKGPAYNKPSPLQAMYFLNKSRKSYKISLVRKDALARLLRCCCIYSIEPQDMEMVLNTVTTLVKFIPAYELFFMKDSSFWDVV